MLRQQRQPQTQYVRTLYVNLTLSATDKWLAVIIRHDG